MRKSRKIEKFALDALEAASEGFEILLATKRYSAVFRHEGLEGVRRIVNLRRQWEMLSWIKKARRSRLIKTNRIGNKLLVTLTGEGRLSLLKLQVSASRLLSDHEKILVSFDFPVKQRKARETFRYFLKGCGFVKLHQSLWCTNRDVVDPLTAIIAKSGARRWIRLFRTVQIRK